MIYRQGVLCILRAFSGNCGYTLKIDSIVDQEKKKKIFFQTDKMSMILDPLIPPLTFYIYRPQNWATKIFR